MTYQAKQVTQDDIDEGYNSFEQDDLGKFYIVVNGCIQFVAKPIDIQITPINNWDNWIKQKD